MSTANRQGIVRVFHSVWTVVTLFFVSLQDGFTSSHVKCSEALSTVSMESLHASYTGCY